ncbi:flavin reductase family protein [Streptomyces sp. OfavH-34-F]|uniref:flavin reductase family protein n=1 Tax=unclassified Streptomyces TaxID=2593676 RepID=UPI001EF26D9F|nr:flavin reductase family protein [Streptomyces sp. OfavH-34-F]MCG7528757.1 flavin reductase family protein [Streptomyces sp. OfavH-34-F]
MSTTGVEPAAVTASELRAAARCLPAGVTVVTSGRGSSVHGMTVSSFTTLSLDPPLASFSVKEGARIRGLIEESGGFAVNVLAAEQAPVARWFADPERPMGAGGFACAAGPAPFAVGFVLSGAIGYFTCRLVRFVEAGDHVIAIGAVERCGTLRDAPPLVFEGGAFRTLRPVTPD